MQRGVLLSHFRPALLLLAVAVFSASAWAQSDPKPIPQKGTDATVITLTNPNPTVPGVVVASTACPFESNFCVFDNFQNATGKTLTSITMFFSSSMNPAGLVFNCPSSQEMLSAVFFDNCSQSAVSNGDVTTGEDVTFSADMKNGFNGVAPCVSPTALSSVSGCSGGLFAIDIYSSDHDLDNLVGATITTTAITTPEPGAGLMVLFSALAFALFKLVRRPV
jgi:hypothetical protein